MLKFEQTGKKTYRIYIHRGFGTSAGNMMEFLGGKTFEEPWVEVERKAGYFYVTDDNMRDKKGDWVTCNTDLGFVEWDDEVQNLDDGRGDAAQCFGISEKLKWQNVVMTPERFQADTIERLAEALGHVILNAWCPGDI